MAIGRGRLWGGKFADVLICASAHERKGVAAAVGTVHVEDEQAKANDRYSVLQASP
jgi:hypothetical protein